MRIGGEKRGKEKKQTEEKEWLKEKRDVWEKVWVGCEVKQLISVLWLTMLTMKRLTDTYNILPGCYICIASGFVTLTLEKKLSK